MFRLAAETNPPRRVLPICGIRAIRGRFLKIFSLFSNFGRQILEKDGERK